MKPLPPYEELMTLAKANAHINRMITTAIPTMDGWCSVEKALTLAGLVLHMRPALCLEIGTYAGRSFLPMLWAIMDNKFGMAVGIDPYDAQISSEQEFPGNCEWWAGLDHGLIERKFHAYLKAMADPKLCEIIRSKSDDVNPPRVIDLLHVDGGHTDVAIRDATRFGAKVPIGGVVVLDDIQWVGGSVLRAIDALQEMGFVEHFRNAEQNWNVMHRVK